MQLTTAFRTHDLTDYPSTTRWLSEREKKFAVARLVTNEDAADRLGHMQAFKASVKDWKTWVGADVTGRVNLGQGADI